MKFYDLTYAGGQISDYNGTSQPENLCIFVPIKYLVFFKFDFP